MSDTSTNQHPETAPNTGSPHRELKLDWTIGEVMSEAWELQKGFKGTYWGALLVFIVISALLDTATRSIGSDGDLMNSLMRLVSVLVTYPLMVGLMMIAIKHSVGIATTASMVFDYYPKTIPIFLTYLLMIVMIGIGFFLLVIPGLYLLFAYMLALPLVADKSLGVWEALETSRKALTPCWFRVAGLSLIGSLVVFVSAIPMGIGLIWALPFLGLAMAIVYRDVLGVAVTK